MSILVVIFIIFLMVMHSERLTGITKSFGISDDLDWLTFFHITLPLRVLVVVCGLSLIAGIVYHWRQFFPTRESLQELREEMG